MTHRNYTDGDTLEIKELWEVAKNYLALADQLKGKLGHILLSKTIINLTIDDRLNENFLMFSAHLASCAIRLCTIDEKLDSKNNTRNSAKQLYGRIKLAIGNDAVPDNEEIISVVYIILRHNVAHIEEDKKPDNSQIKSRLYLQQWLQDVPKETLFDYMKNSCETIKSRLIVERII